MQPVTFRHLLTALALLWLAGNALRLPILAVPPVLTGMRADLGMSGTQVGVLTGLPVVIFAIVAVPGALLIARIGAVPALLVGLAVAALGSGLRLGAGNVTLLYLATIVMGTGIAVMQPALPAVVRQWLPDRIGLGTAVFTNGLIIGEIIPVALMLPAVMPLAGNDWRAALAFWGLPILAIALAIVLLQPRAAASAKPAERPRWWPDWAHPHVWRPALMLGGANAAYFGANTFLPGYLDGAGRPDLIGSALTALNLGQLPASFLLLAVASRIERRAWPFIVLGLLSLASIAVIVASASYWTVAFAAVLGFCAGGTLALSLTLPALLRQPADIASTSAAMFVVGYTQAVTASVLGGAAWDLFGAPAWSFLPVALVLLPLVLLPATIRFERAPQ